MMRTGVPAGHTGHVHEAFCYGSDDELLAVVMPFLLDGVAAGEPVLVSLGGRAGSLVRSALPAGSGVSFLPGGQVYDRPTGTIRAYRDLLASHVADGAGQVRVVGELPRAALGVTWDWWARYEAAVNHAYDDFPVWTVCAYDTRLTPAPVLVDVARTHPRFATADGGHVPSDAYTDPVTYLEEDRPVVPDPLQRTPPLVELTDPSPAAARAAVYDADGGLLPTEDVEDLVVAVSETVTNALRHGRPPVRVRMWTGVDRIVVTVSDSGQGPKDPFAGLLPAVNRTAGGLGLWIAYQSCSHVTAHRGPDGYTLRMTAGNPHFTG
jgi:anti-sigma regulatory factor (Ser/Thr protein kinase)